MSQINNFIVNPDIIESCFNSFANKSPFNLKKSIKNFNDEYNIIEDDELFTLLSLELSTAYKTVKPKNFIYHNAKKFRIAIIKFRMKNKTILKGKSNGWRVIGLVDEENDIFFLLDIYSHSQGKDDLTPNENKAIRKLCDEYVNNIE